MRSQKTFRGLHVVKGFGEGLSQEWNLSSPIRAPTIFWVPGIRDCVVRSCNGHRPRCLEGGNDEAEKSI